ncbi:MAG: exodeoxyribonuclease VII small subunit [Flavobacteriales bacterium]|nr:exodeoxyribonuclease VII small subunit [Flavobacteriales bacterium]
MADNKLKYEDAISELEEIVDKIENADISVDDLSIKVKRASELIKVCKDILHKTDKEVQKILEGMDK